MKLRPTIIAIIATTVVAIPFGFLGVFVRRQSTELEALRTETQTLQRTLAAQAVPQATISKQAALPPADILGVKLGMEVTEAIATLRRQGFLITGDTTTRVVAHVYPDDDDWPLKDSVVSDLVVDLNTNLRVVSKIFFHKSYKSLVPLEEFQAAMTKQYGKPTWEGAGTYAIGGFLNLKWLYPSDGSDCLKGTAWPSTEWPPSLPETCAFALTVNASVDTGTKSHNKFVTSFALRLGDPKG
jgi:hypothetical protein